MIDKIANWDATGWREVMESLGNPEFHHIYLKDKSLHPFRSVSWMPNGKSRLVFLDEVSDIKVGDLVYVWAHGRALCTSGWVTSIEGQVINLSNPLRNYLAMPQKV